MITAVNLNPCIDKSIVVSGFQYGQLNRVMDSREEASGKAINVGIAVKRIGKEVECLGFNYKENGKILENTLNDYGITSEFVWVNGRLRTNTKILDSDTNILTELNEFGSKVTNEDINKLRTIIKEHAEKSSLVVIGGSAPVGVSSSIYREILEELSEYPIKTILDAEKDFLLEGIEAQPYLIKPNLFELETAFGKKCSSKEEVVLLAREIIESGVEVVCVSLGEEGAVICNKKEAYYSQGLQLKIQGIQGAGDSMVAGICAAIEEGLPIQEMLRYGMAASAASLVLKGTQMCSLEGFCNYRKQIQIQKMEV